MDLPAEIVADILSRNPIKKTVHCRCVCKTWRAILSEAYFIDLHLSRSPVGLIIHHSNPPHETDNLKLGELDEKTDHHDIHYDPLMRFDLGLGFEYNLLLLSGTVNGLVCLWNYHNVVGYITNPVTREYILLPDHKYDITSFTIAPHDFGYVEASNEYKVVSLYMETNLDMNIDTNIDKSECKIYTLGTGMWRSLGHLPFSVISVQNGIYVCGNLHWLTNDQKDTRKEIVCTFDLEKELFHLTASAPLFYGMNGYDRDYRGLGTLGGCLCIIDNTADSELSIWVMKDYGMKESWTKEIVIKDKPGRLQYQIVRPLIFLKSGSILMVCCDRFLFTYCPESGALQIIECGPKDAYDAMVYVPSFIRLTSFMLEKVLVF
ncbi:F-box protein At3g07870-like [Apium graveolens]|uniref:F-box protein At3g07870-like n=1 Tax=Apium graveolens TaxID=4045 RepID=UPI003D7BDF82